MTLTVLPEAELETTEAAIWYEDRRARLGDDFLAELRCAFDFIQREPQGSALLESYTGAFEIRRHRLKHFPYLVIYACLPSDCIVVAVTHVRRKPLYWLDRLGSE